MTFVAIVYQGDVLDIEAVALEGDLASAQEAALAAAEAKNAQLTSETVGYTGRAVEVTT